jgi:hypothetical protein
LFLKEWRDRYSRGQALLKPGARYSRCSSDLAGQRRFET